MLVRALQGASGGGVVTYHGEMNNLSPSTSYNFNFGFKPKHFAYRFFRTSTGMTTHAGFVDVENATDNILWYNGSSANYINTTFPLSNLDVSSTGITFTTEPWNNSMTENIEVIAYA